MKRSGQPSLGSLKRLHATSVYKPKAPNKLRGFWRGPKSRPAFKPLVLGQK